MVEAGPSASGRNRDSTLYMPSCDSLLMKLCTSCRRLPGEMARWEIQSMVASPISTGDIPMLAWASMVRNSRSMVLICVVVEDLEVTRTWHADRSLVHVLAAVHRQGGTGDEIRVVGYQEGHRAGDVLGPGPVVPPGSWRRSFSSTFSGTARTMSVST